MHVDGREFREGQADKTYESLRRYMELDHKSIKQAKAQPMHSGSGGGSKKDEGTAAAASDCSSKGDSESDSEIVAATNLFSSLISKPTAPKKSAAAAASKNALTPKKGKTTTQQASPQKPETETKADKLEVKWMQEIHTYKQQMLKLGEQFETVFFNAECNMKDPKYREQLKKKTKGLTQSCKDMRNTMVPFENRLKRAKEVPKTCLDAASDTRTQVHHLLCFTKNVGNANANETALGAAIQVLSMKCAAAHITLFQIQCINAVRFSKWEDLRKAIDAVGGALNAPEVATSKRDVVVLITDVLQESLENMFLPIKNKVFAKDDQIAEDIVQFIDVALSLSKVPEAISEELGRLHKVLKPPENCSKYEPSEAAERLNNFTELTEAVKAGAYTGIFTNMMNTPFFAYLQTKAYSHDDGVEAKRKSQRKICWSTLPPT